MMAFVGLFMGGSPHAMIPAGQAVLNLQWQAEDRQDIQGASFTVTGPGVNKTVPAGADGRAEITIPSGKYTVTVSHSGQYVGDDPLTVIAESQKAYLVLFDGKKDRVSIGFFEAEAKIIGHNHAEFEVPADIESRVIWVSHASILDRYGGRRDLIYGGSVTMDHIFSAGGIRYVVLSVIEPPTGLKDGWVSGLFLYRK